MAGSYESFGSTREVQVISPTNVMDVERVGARTIPSQVYFEYPIPIGAQNTASAQFASNADFYLGAIASSIELLMASGEVVGANFVQDFDASNLLTDYMDFIVQYIAPGAVRPPFQTTVRVQMDTLLGGGGDLGRPGDQGAGPLIQAAYNQLVALAGL